MKYFIGWDVGAWNCGRSSSSQDAFVVFTDTGSGPRLTGRPFRGPLRDEIAGIESLPHLLHMLCEIDIQPNDEYVIGIDTPLGLPEAVQWHVTGTQLVASIEQRAAHNPYLYRKCEQRLADRGFPPLSAIKDMIGSQCTKGMHFLRKLDLKPQSHPVGVWSSESITAIEAYPATCKECDTKGYVSLGSPTLKQMFQQIQGEALSTVDEQDALYCALVAYLFATRRDALVSPDENTPPSEGWIWYPQDSQGRRSKKRQPTPRNTRATP